jgi:drug/metabolite transporter (DMT)-like permease
VRPILPILFAGIAAIGNAMFALGQKESSGVKNGLSFVAASAFIAFVLSTAMSASFGSFDLEAIARHHWKSVTVSGVGLFLTYFGFNLLYSRFGVSQYLLYASLSIITTTVLVGFVVLKEPVSPYRIAAIALAIAAVVLFSLGQSRL